MNIKLQPNHQYTAWACFLKIADLFCSKSQIQLLQFGAKRCIIRPLKIIIMRTVVIFSALLTSIALLAGIYFAGQIEKIPNYTTLFSIACGVVVLGALSQPMLKAPKRDLLWALAGGFALAAVSCLFIIFTYEVVGRWEIVNPLNYFLVVLIGLAVATIVAVAALKLYFTVFCHFDKWLY